MLSTVKPLTRREDMGGRSALGRTARPTWEGLTSICQAASHVMMTLRVRSLAAALNYLTRSNLSPPLTFPAQRGGAANTERNPILMRVTAIPVCVRVYIPSRCPAPCMASW